MSQSDFFQQGSRRETLAASLKKINTTSRGYRSCQVCLKIGFHHYGKIDPFKKTTTWVCSALCLQKDKLNMYDYKEQDADHISLTLESSMKAVASFVDNVGWSKSFKDLTKDPSKAMNRIYDYLELESYDKHNFNNVEEITKDDDSVYGIYGDHEIKPVVSELPQDYVDVLGVKTSNYIKDVGEFYFKYFNY